MDINHSENIILRNIIENPIYLDKARERFFKNNSFQIILKTTKDFWNSYKTTPSLEQLKEAIKLSDNSIKVTEGEIDALYEIKLNNYDEEWLKQSTELFIEYRNLTESAIDAIQYIQKTSVNSDNIGDVISTFKKIILDRNNIDFSFDEGLDFFDPESHKQLLHHTFSSGFNFIDLVLGGGFRAKSLYVFMGMPKVGKSLWLSNIGAEAIKSGHNVAIISLEMSDRKYIKRIGANILNTKMNEYDALAENSELLKKKLSTLAYSNLRLPGRFFIKEFPTSQASVIDIESYLKKVEETHNIKFKIVIIDYINIMKNWRNPNSENTYMKIKQIAEDLRGIATSNEWSIITATQTKQSEFDSSDLTISSTSESSGLVATVDGMFGIIQDPIMYANKEYKLKILANRDDGYKNAHQMFDVDYNYMRIRENTNTPIYVE